MAARGRRSRRSWLLVGAWRLAALASCIPEAIAAPAPDGEGRGALRVQVRTPESAAVRCEVVVRTRGAQLSERLARPNAGMDHRFTNLPAGADSYVCAWAEGYRPTIAQAEVVAGEERVIKVVLDPGASVQGTTVDAQDQPVVGAQVSLTVVGGEDPAPDGWRPSSYREPQRTDAEGRFLFRGLPPRAVSLRAHCFAERYPGGLHSDATIEVKAPALGMRITLWPPPGADLLLVHPDGTRFGARGEDHVQVVRWLRGDYTSVRISYLTCLGGHLSLDPLPEGNLEVEIRSRGHVPILRSFRADRRARANLGTIVLQTGHVVRGRVLGPDGAPLRDATVWARAPGAGPPARDIWLPAAGLDRLVGNLAVTERDGSFELEHVAAGPVFLEAMREGLAGVPVRLEVTPQLAPVELRLGAGGSVACVLRAPSGSPVAGARLMAVRLPEDGGPALPSRRVPRATGDDGRADFRLSPGRWRIVRWPSLREPDLEERALGEWTLRDGEQREVAITVP